MSECQEKTVSAEECQAARDLVAFIAASPSMFHAASQARALLEQAGFTYLPEGDAWSVAPDTRAYTVRNNSSVIAFAVGGGVHAEGAGAPAEALHFQIVAAHGDSPTFKLKTTADTEGAGGTRVLDVEAYGGMIDYTWFDKPLSVAGRLMVRTPEGVESCLVAPDEDLLIIPSLAVHLDRTVNEGFSPNRAQDLRPLVSAGVLGEGDFEAHIARSAGVAPEDVLARDLFLVNRQPGCVWGAAQEFVSAPKLDDLMCAYTSLKGFIAAGVPAGACVNAWCLFDNEEVGSHTKQGALSTFLPDTLGRVCDALGAGAEGYRRALSRSMLVSCDNAHAVHPNHPEKYDARNQCRLNGGLVIKEAANQHYCTDAFSRAALAAVLDRAGLPYQTFANRSDMAGGATLGNLSNMQASMHAVDVGCAQLAMHSAFETAGARDVTLVARALQAFFEADLIIEGADRIRIA